MTHDTKMKLQFSTYFIIKKSFCFLFLIFFCYILPIYAQTQSTRDINAKRSSFIQAAKSYIGTPYVSGGTSKAGMDCSGLIYRAAIDALDMQVPRTVSALSKWVERISDTALTPGDLLFFNTTGKISHVAIYIGNEKFIHAASDGPKTGVIISNRFETYWKQRYVFAGRILPQEDVRITDPEQPEESVPPPKSPQTSIQTDLFPFEGAIGFRINTTGGILWDFMPDTFPLRGVSINCEASWVKNVPVYPGISVGYSWDARSSSHSIPLFISVTGRQGIRFFLGTQFHLVANKTLDTTPQFPGLIGVSWTSAPTHIWGQNLRFYQSAEYSWFPNETFGAGFRLNTGITFSFDM